MSELTNFAFVHGGGQGSWVWDETIAALVRQSGGTARCLALDAPGCGTKRGRDTSQIAFDDIAAELVADIADAGMTDVILVGHSQAGMELPQMAELRPDLIGKLVFVTCSAPLPGKTTLDQMGWEYGHGESADHVGYPVGPDASPEERYRAMFCNDMGPDEADAFLAKLGKDMWPPVCYSHSDWRREHLKDKPVTYVLCERDMSLPPDWQQRFAERLHADRTVRIDAGHQVMNTQPERLAEVLLAEAAG